MDAKRQDLTNSIGLLILRVGIGGYMLSHGWGKFMMMIDGKWSDFGDPIGIGSTLSLIGAAGAEFFCAALVMLGAATRFAAAPIVFTMVVAAFVAHSGDPWTSGEAARLFMEGKSQYPASKEMALLFALPFLALIFTGAGKFSVDGMVWPRFRQWRKDRKA